MAIYPRREKEEKPSDAYITNIQRLDRETEKRKLSAYDCTDAIKAVDIEQTERKKKKRRRRVTEMKHIEIVVTLFQKPSPSISH